VRIGDLGYGALLLLGLLACLASWFFALGLWLSISAGWGSHPGWQIGLILLVYGLAPVAIATAAAIGTVRLALEGRRRPAIECALIALVTPVLMLVALHLTLLGGAA
jgi:hypothetical protein